MLISILSVRLSISSSYYHRTTHKLYVSGCHAMSKVSTKEMGLKATLKYGFDLLHSFGKEWLTEEVITLAEQYLVWCMSTNQNRTSFDEQRYLKLA